VAGNQALMFVFSKNKKTFPTFDKILHHDNRRSETQDFRQIDSLEKSRLEDLYGILINYINGQKDIADW